MGLLPGLFRGLQASGGDPGRPAAAPFVRTVPVIVNCRDRVTCLRRLVAWLEEAGHENIVLLDNASTYPPLIEFFGSCGHRVERLNRNLGHTALWQAEALAPTIREQWFVYTDPDVVPDESCPPDTVEKLRELLDRHAAYVKAGLALRTDDLPGHYRPRAQVIEHERQFYARPIEPDVYDSFVDTTFALYRPGTPYSHGPALRSTRFRARHLAWYIDTGAPGDEETYYSERADRRVANWMAGAARVNS